MFLDSTARNVLSLSSMIISQSPPPHLYNTVDLFWTVFDAYLFPMIVFEKIVTSDNKRIIF